MIVTTGNDVTGHTIASYVGIVRRRLWQCS